MHELGLTVYNQEKACHGYTLFSPMTGTAAYLIDMHGEIVHRWSRPFHEVWPDSPDLDRRLISFVEKIRGAAGWPLNVFLKCISRHSPPRCAPS